jgi:hypothetical protein
MTLDVFLKAVGPFRGFDRPVDPAEQAQGESESMVGDPETRIQLDGLLKRPPGFLESSLVEFTIPFLDKLEIFGRRRAR